MAAELEREAGVLPVLHQSYGGVFEIEVNGEMLFSKARLGRFPEAGEVQGLLKAKVG